MSIATSKCVIIINDRVGNGIAANTAACLGFSLGALLPQEIGPPQPDADGRLHGGLLNIPLPILAAEPKHLKQLTNAAYAHPDLTVVDMSDIAQRAKTQTDYAAALAEMSTKDLSYWGVVVYGEAKVVNKLVGNLKLFGR